MTDRIRSLLRRPVGWPTVVAVIAAILLTAEISARIVEDDLPVRSGSEERAVVKAEQMRARRRTRVAVIGSSEAAAGIIPSELVAAAPSLGSAYNAGLVGSHLSVSGAWYTRIVQPLLTPDIVVIGVLPLGLLSYADVDAETAPTDDPSRSLRAVKAAFVENSEAYESVFDRIDPGFFGIRAFDVERRSALLRNRSRLRSPTALAEGIGSLVTGHGASDEDAASIRADIGPEGENLEYAGAGDSADVAESIPLYREAARQPLDLDMLGDLVDTVAATGAQPVLALAPLDRETLGRHGLELGAWDRRAEEIRTWAEERGLLVDGWPADPYPATDFHDRHHLRRSGAIRWSRELGAWLEELCGTGQLRGC